MLRRLMCACFTCVTLFGSLAVTAADGSVLLGAIYNLSGPQSAFDEPSFRGAELAVARANAEGGVLGQRVELVIADPEGNLDRATEEARGLVDTHPSLSAVFGLSDTDMVLAAAPVAAEHQLVFMTSGATSPKLPAQVPEYLFLACFGDNVQAAAAAEYAYNDLAARTASILYNSSKTYTTLLQGYFRTRFETLGGKVVTVERYRTTEEQGDALAGLAEADVVFLSAEEPAEAAAGVIKLRQAGFTGPVLGGDGFDAENEWSKHPELQDVYFTTHAYLGHDNPDPKVRAFDGSV